jgi:hypothetical protein
MLRFVLGDQIGFTGANYIVTATDGTMTTGSGANTLPMQASTEINSARVVPARCLAIYPDEDFAGIALFPNDNLGGTPLVIGFPGIISNLPGIQSLWINFGRTLGDFVKEIENRLSLKIDNIMIPEFRAVPPNLYRTWCVDCGWCGGWTDSQQVAKDKATQHQTATNHNCDVRTCEPPSSVAFCGGGYISEGKTEFLGYAYTFDNINVSVSGPAVVRIEAWDLEGFLRGTWHVSGPGGKAISIFYNLYGDKLTQYGNWLKIKMVGESVPNAVWVNYN